MFTLYAIWVLTITAAFISFDDCDVESVVCGTMIGTLSFPFAVALATLIGAATAMITF